MRRGPDFASMRAEMVERQLRRREISDERVLEAMGGVPRELFVPARLRSRAYADSALPIGAGQTISQPWIVAAICQALRLEGGERVLEVGTGSGYSAAVLDRLAREVIGIELQEELAAAARAVLAEVGAAGVEVILGDGGRGLPERPPFDAIAVHATAPAPPRALLEQLADGGRLVAPVAAGDADMLTVFRREGGRFTETAIGPCRFVPLLGEEGFPPPG
jgi:protein-L-isoaspartate(D-aspartate) O-methyltransferase